MQKSSLSLILTVVFLISGGFFNIAEAQTTGSSGGICPGLITDKLAHPMTALARPARLQAVTDPQFGTTIRRITDVKNDGRGANNVLKPVYSTVSAWNADESRLILYRTAGSGAGGHELFDGRTYEFIRKLDDIDPADLEQIYWDTTDADILYYVNRVTRQMIRYHVSTKVKDVKHDFSSICSTDLHGGTDPMFTSWDSKMIGLVCGNKIFSYNLATDTVNTQLTLATGNNAPQATPSGTRFFLNENDTKGTVRDANMNILLTLNILDSGTHASMSRLSNGRDTFNSVDFDDTLNGTLVQHDMVTGIKRVFVGPSTGYPYPPSGTHVTGMAFKRPGLVGVSVKGNLNGSGLLDSELLLVDTDPATNPSGEVCRIGHHRTASDDYWAEPHPVLSPSGTRLLFGSSWGNTGVIVDSYVVELPSYTGGSVTPPPPDTTAPSVPAGLTATAISSSQINLSWTASTDNVSIGGYRIYRNGVEISTTGNTTYSDTNLSPSTTYTYRVASCDGSNNTSAQSAAVSATTPAEVLPPLLTDSTVVENFSTVRSFADGTVFGACNLLTMETAGSPSLSNASGRYLQASSAQKTDGFIVRSANALPATYKVSVDIGGINFDLLDPVDEENGAYFISITNQAGAPQLNSWWHTNRKVMIDTDNNIWGSGGTHPIFFGYYTTSNADYFYNQSTSAWTNSWVSASNYQPDTWYTFEIEKNTTQYIYRAYNTITGALVRQATIPIASVRGSTSPDYFAIGDPHTNYYNGSMKIANIRITNTGCGSTTPPPSGDSTAPSVPAGLTATAVSSSQINLSWTASTDNVGVTGYNVYRNGTQIASVAATSYSDTGLTASTAYSYSMQATDAAGNVSLQSGGVSATTQSVTTPPTTDTTIPTTPTNLFATAVSSSQVSLTWTASTDNVGVTGYRIYRAGTLLTTVTTTSYSNTGLSPSTTYSYTVQAIDAANNASAQSASASATTLTTTPSTSTAYDFEGGTMPAVFDVTSSAPWVIATDQKHAGTYSIKSGNAGSGNSFSQLTLLANFEAGDVSFWRRYETELNYDKFIFLIDGVPQSGYPKSGSGTVWTQDAFTSTLTAGVHSLDWIYAKDSGSNSGGDAVWLDDIAVPNFTAINDKGESFESGIPSTWTNDATEVWSTTNAAYRKKLGSNSARSYATIGGNGASTLQRTVTTSVGDMWFYYYISSETGFDFLRFYIDDVEKTNVAASGDYDSTRATLNSGWIFRKYSVTAASHTFKWEYTTDGGTTLGNNAAFIEMVYFPVTSGTTPPPTPAPTVALIANPTSVTSGSLTTVTWSSTNATSCTASGGWTGTKATSGSQAITGITTNTTYTLSCTGTGGTTNQSTTITVTAPPTCTSFTYSAWSSCQSNNTQSRTTTASSPQGCTGGTPILTQSCIYTPPSTPTQTTCTTFTYSTWDICQSNNTQSRTTTSTSPQGCTGGTPTLTQSCTYTPPATTPPLSTGGGGTTSSGGGTTSTGGSTSGGTTTGGTTSGGTTTTGGSTTTSGGGGTTTGTTGGTTTTLPPLTGPFGIGMRSDQVKLLQQMLIQDGSMSGEATGYYGPLTQKAVETFQIKYNLVISGTPATTGFGLAGPGTRAKLNSLYANGGSPTDREALLASLRKQVADLMVILQGLIAKLAALKAAKGIAQ